MQKQSPSFIGVCKQFCFAGITPANPAQRTSKEYKVIAAFFQEGKEKEFSDYFMEGQYFINLWAAHLILEHGKPDSNLKRNAWKLLRGMLTQH